MKNVYIFDMDGTLVDTHPGFHSCLNNILKVCEKPEISFDQYMEISLAAKKDWFEILTTEDDFKKYFKDSYPDLVRKVESKEITYVAGFRSVFSDYYTKNKHYEKSKLIDRFKTLSFLTSLRNSGSILILLSNSNHNVVKSETSRLGLTPYFDLILGSGDKLEEGVITAKPDPEIFKLISKHMKIHPRIHNITMVGDTLNDVRFAKNSKLNCILLSTNKNFTESDEVRKFDLAREGRLKIFKSITELSEQPRKLDTLTLSWIY